MGQSPDTSNPNAWVGDRPPSSEARFRLFCFPFAGGSALTYRQWHLSLPREVEVCPIHLPGRRPRRDPALTRLTVLVEMLAPALLPWLDRPYAFFGHSLGALISFDLARFLRRHQHPTPTKLFVSAQRAPQFRPRGEPAHQLPEPALIDRLHRLNGIPEEMLSDARLLQLLLPVLRADFEVYETYDYLPEEPLECDISAFGGTQDSVATRADLEAWGEQTRGAFELQMLPGNHFFITAQRSLLLQLLSRDLQRLLHPQDLGVRS